MVSVKVFARRRRGGPHQLGRLRGGSRCHRRWSRTPPPPAPVETGWYLRGDVGVGMQSFGSFDHSQTNAAFVWPASWSIVQQNIQDTALAGSASATRSTTGCAST